MPKQTFTNGVMQITEDINDPKDRLLAMKMSNKGKNSITLTVQEKADLFDAYLAAGIISL